MSYIEKVRGLNKKLSEYQVKAAYAASCYAVKAAENLFLERADYYLKKTDECVRIAEGAGRAIKRNKVLIAALTIKGWAKK